MRIQIAAGSPAFEVTGRATRGGRQAGRNRTVVHARCASGISACHPGIGGALGEVPCRCNQAGAGRYELPEASFGEDGFGARPPRIAVGRRPSGPLSAAFELQGHCRLHRVGGDGTSCRRRCRNGTRCRRFGHLSHIEDQTGRMRSANAGTRWNTARTAAVRQRRPGHGPGGSAGKFPAQYRRNTLPLTVSPGHIHLFDPGKGNRHV